MSTSFITYCRFALWGRRLATAVDVTALKLFAVHVIFLGDFETSSNPSQAAYLRHSVFHFAQAVLFSVFM
jgi:hypothetical protein